MSDTAFIIGQDTILYGDELQEGMEVKRERSYLDPQGDYARITKLRTYTTTDSGGFLSSSPVTRKHITWVGVYEDGRQESVTTSPEQPWIVFETKV